MLEDLPIRNTFDDYFSGRGRGSRHAAAAAAGKAGKENEILFFIFFLENIMAV